MAKRRFGRSTEGTCVSAQIGQSHWASEAEMVKSHSRASRLIRSYR